MRVKMLIVLVLLTGITGHLIAADLPRITARGSATVWRNSGWGEKFFFHTLTSEQLRGGPIDLSKTLRHTSIFNVEMWWTPLNVSDDFSLSAVAKYRRLSFTLGDSINFSFERSMKGLDADLNFLSAGFRLSHPLWLLNVYGGADAGYCFGSLFTDQYMESPSNFIYHIQVDGNGGGVFSEFVVGISTIPVPCGFFIEPGFFFEVGLRTTTEWDPFNVDEVRVIRDAGPVTPILRDTLMKDDRQLSVLQGVFLSLGLEIKVL